jgi:C-terminal processing protease CtpA/Prc
MSRWIVSLSLICHLGLLGCLALAGCGEDAQLADSAPAADGGADQLPADGARPDAAPASCSPAAPGGACPAGRTCSEGACIVDLDPKKPVSDKAAATKLFEAIWSFYDQSYGAFPAKPKLDWSAVKTSYKPRVAAAKTQFELVWTLQRMVAEIGDGHTYALEQSQCSTTGYWGNAYANVGACVTEGDDGNLYVYKLGAGNPSGFKRGDRLLSIDGRDVTALLRDAEHQPRCSIYHSTKAMQRARLVDGLLFRGPKDRKARVRRAGKELELTLQVATSPGQLLGCDGVVGVDKPTERAHGILEKTLPGDVLYVYLPIFGAYDAKGTFVIQPVIDELRKVFTAAKGNKGMILDLRANRGGSPSVYMALASWLYKQATTLFHCHNKTGTGHNDLGPKWSMTSVPDTTLQYDGPLAVLVSPTTFSAGDFTSYWLPATGRAKSFGAASGGGFGNGNSKKDTSWTLGYNNIYCLGLKGQALEGHPPAPDVKVGYRPADLAAGTDTVIEKALAWIKTQ